MTDEELANKLGEAAGAMFRTYAPWPDWLAVARKAKELLVVETSLPTDLEPTYTASASMEREAERAVIAAAEAYVTEYGKQPYNVMADAIQVPAVAIAECAIHGAVRHLREVRQPKPRWTFYRGKLTDTTEHATISFSIACIPQELGERIARLLNQSEEK